MRIICYVSVVGIAIDTLVTAILIKLCGNHKPIKHHEKVILTSQEEK